ncbi:MucR family transcriptional regulator [Methylobacterium sp. JK268]
MNEELATPPIELVSDIISALVSHNNVPMSQLPALIQSVHQALGALGKPAEPEPVKLTPAVPIKKSVTPDAIISLEDGKPYKALKRHLSGRGLTPDDYGKKWGLPSDYPMVAPSYAAARPKLAKNLGLGQIRPNRVGVKRTAGAAKIMAEPTRSRGRRRKADA